MSITPKEILEKYWSYPAFRETQEEIITSVIQGKDTLALLPTGGGKSVCFQVSGLCRNGITIVVSPLIALMKDQVENLRTKGLNAFYISSANTSRDIDRILDNCIHGDVKFLYVSPERLMNEVFQARLKQMNVGLLAVDEAHCISQWGYDFRPSYLKIAEIRGLLPASVPCIALTATATPIVVKDLLENLKMEDANVLTMSFVRNNLSYNVRNETEKTVKLFNILSKVKGTAIVYVRNRKACREISEKLNNQGISSSFYHAGLSHKERDSIQNSWMKGTSRVIVATNAFGMGIDKSDVRCVIHMDIPDSLEAYFQEAGRAGRDGERSFAVLLFNQSDLDKIEERLQNNFPLAHDVRKVYDLLGSYLKLAIGSGEQQGFDFDLFKFCNFSKLQPVKTLNCLKLLEQFGYLSLSNGLKRSSSLTFKTDRKGIELFLSNNPGFSELTECLLRTYPGITNEYSTVSEKKIGATLSIDHQRIINGLNKMKDFGVVDYIPSNESDQIFYLLPRCSKENILLDNVFITARRADYMNRLDKVKNYVLTKVVCRSSFLVNYFGEEDAKPCGICDVCVGRKNSGLKPKEFEQIAYMIKEEIKLEPKPIQYILTYKKEIGEDKSLTVINWLLDHGQIEYNEQNKLVWVE